MSKELCEKKKLSAYFFLRTAILEMTLSTLSYLLLYLFSSINKTLRTHNTQFCAALVRPHKVSCGRTTACTAAQIVK